MKKIDWVLGSSFVLIGVLGLSSLGADLRGTVKAVGDDEMAGIVGGASTTPTCTSTYFRSVDVCTGSGCTSQNLYQEGGASTQNTYAGTTVATCLTKGMTACGQYNVYSGCTFPAVIESE